ncbi:MAG TPA: hypothetical protein VHO69_01665 [Phototrophicaceae bacterium]|nr:hypothetical protein [Phototrophicaceae bacterium]
MIYRLGNREQTGYNPAGCEGGNSSLSYAHLRHKWVCFVQPKRYGMNYCTPYPIAKAFGITCVER